MSLKATVRLLPCPGGNGEAMLIIPDEFVEALMWPDDAVVEIEAIQLEHRDTYVKTALRVERVNH